ncbi:MAG: glycerophosphodiester phosphodiesterase family protein, partial [Candidatus Izemoplasmatales bacterium]|jgi:glycerophosphoryl diester phosphodiesterase
LKDYLSICKAYQKQAIIELKDNLSNSHLDQVIHEVEKYHSLNESSIISFNDKYLLYLRKNYPDLSLFLLSGVMNEKVYELCEKNRFYLDIHSQAIDEATIKRFHLIGLKVAVYTVNDKEAAEKLIKMGVDFVTTDILE